MIVRHYKNKRKRRHSRVRKNVKGRAECPRLSVFRSNKYIYGQVIDDEEGVTLVAASSLEKRKKKSAAKNKKSNGLPLSSKMRVAYEVGKLIAEKAQEKKIKKAIFDRGGYRYHGRVKAFAEGAREGGLDF